MTPLLAPVEKPSHPLLKLGYFFTRKQLGTVPVPLNLAEQTGLNSYDLRAHPPPRHPPRRRELQGVLDGQPGAPPVQPQGAEGHKAGARRGPPRRGEDVPLAMELRDGDPVSELLSQAGDAATSGAAVVMGV
jgi:hypothetical protein